MTQTPAETLDLALKVAADISALVILVWMYRDARARDANPILWAAAAALSALFIHWALALIAAGIYLLFRPKGRLLRCPHCRARYIYWLAQCPKCEGPLKKDCPRCHSSVPYAETACPDCGALL